MFKGASKGQRLENYQTIRRVVIRRDGFRITLDHDRLKPASLQRNGRMTTRNSRESDALADGGLEKPETEDHDFVESVGWARLSTSYG